MMQIQQRRQGQWCVYTISGSIDGQTARHLEETFQAAVDDGETYIAADLSKVHYLSSAGLRVFLSTLKLLSGGSGELRLINPVEHIKDVLDMSGFSKILKISNSLED